MTWNTIAQWGAVAGIAIAALAIANALGLNLQDIFDAITFATENSQ